MQDDRPVLILGAGINGTAIARELALRSLPVVLIDTHDIAYGATSRSSRLIHGGLRYLEYGEFDLVKESLGERKHLLKYAPHLVKPLRLHTPTPGRLGGWVQSIKRFFGWKVKQPAPRGMWLVRTGLMLYQLYANDSQSRRVTTQRPGDGESPPVNNKLYRWVNSYDDGQVLWPERLALEWLLDGSSVAAERSLRFDVFTRAAAEKSDDTIRFCPSSFGEDDKTSTLSLSECRPRLIINATGSWVDEALRKLETPSKRLMGGTKGSHLFVANEDLRAVLGEDGVYVEAADCRPVFILPMADVVLIGTTDIPFDEPPGSAVAEDHEIEYLLDATRRVFPQIDLSREQVVAHYAGVRPLPYVDASSPGAITRRHFLHPHENVSPPVLSIIGGKLTTCRALAEEAADWVLEHYGDGGVTASSADRPTPGGRDYPSESELAARQQQLADRFALPTPAIAAVWRLYGVRTAEVLQAVADYGDDSLKPIAAALPLPLGLARYVVQHEWARSLEDIVERRLFLVHASILRRSWLADVARAAALESPLSIETQVERCIQRLREFYGRVVVEDVADRNTADHDNVDHDDADKDVAEEDQA